MLLSVVLLIRVLKTNRIILCLSFFSRSPGCSTDQCSFKVGYLAENVVFVYFFDRWMEGCKFYLKRWNTNQNKPLWTQNYCICSKEYSIFMAKTMVSKVMAHLLRISIATARFFTRYLWKIQILVEKSSNCMIKIHWKWTIIM